MSNRIYETFDSEYGIFRYMQCFVGTQKNRLNEKLVFVYLNTYFCKNLTERRIITFWFNFICNQSPFKLKLLKAHFEMSETRALRVEKSEYLNGSLFIDNQLRKGIGFEIWNRICSQN